MRRSYLFIFLLLFLAGCQNQDYRWNAYTSHIFGNSTGYVIFGEDGTMNMYGTARVKEQEKLLAVSAVKGNSAPANTLRSVGSSGTLLKPMISFSQTIQQDIYFEFHSPYAMDYTSPADFHLVWAPGTSWTSGNYIWKLEYLVIDEDANLSLRTPITISMNITPTNKNIIETEFIDLINFTDDDQILVAHLYRDVANDNANDVGDVDILEMNYYKNKQGEKI